MRGALSDKRMGLSFTIAAGPRQRSQSRVRVPWISRPYFTVSVLRLPFSSPPTTRRVTVEVFDPASTRVNLLRNIPTAPLIIIRHGPHGKHRLSVGKNACLLARYLAMDIRGPHRKHPLRTGYIFAGVYFGRCLEMGLHVTVYLWVISRCCN
jgi:hypothetical protein